MRRTSITLWSILIIGLVACYPQKPFADNPAFKKSDKIITYKLPNFKTYASAINCDNIMSMKNVEKAEIIDKETVDKYVKIFLSNNAFSNIDYNYDKIDSRSKIDFIFDDIVISSVCLSSGGLIQVGNKIYKPSGLVFNFLVEQKFIITIE
jgi:hypothetical protein